MPKQLDQAYEEFRKLYADSQPIRSPAELQAAMRAANITSEQATTEWLESLDKRWVYGKADYPFDDDQANRAYWRYLGGAE